MPRSKRNKQVSLTQVKKAGAGPTTKGNASGVYSEALCVLRFLFARASSYLGYLEQRREG